MRRNGWALVGLAGLSVIATAIHGWAHATIPVESPTWRLLLVVVLLFLAPILGAVLAASDRRRIGAWTLLLAGLGGLTLEGVLHFVVRNPDHVATVERGHALFANTAVLSTAGDALLVLGAGWVLWHQAQGSSSNSSIASMR